MPLRLTLICHGATAATRTAAFALDEPIEAGAVSQAAALQTTLSRVDRAWTSPALRARQTATALALDAAVDSDLRDCDHGRWAGRTLADLHREDPSGIAAWIADVDAVPHGGESIAGLCRRVSAWMSQRIGENGHTVAVTHVSVMRAAILHVLEAPHASFWRIDIEPLSSIDLRSDGTRWTLRAAGARFSRKQ
jgi:broad specificity phosphatase PhoE